ncbi:MAG: hypothetical protein IPL65_11775 [Lewinellaceae bacterium]|nr:hypothetical protein [Lewinellaceae bacterium]
MAQHKTGINDVQSAIVGHGWYCHWRLDKIAHQVAWRVEVLPVRPAGTAVGRAHEIRPVGRRHPGCWFGGKVHVPAVGAIAAVNCQPGPVDGIFYTVGAGIDSSSWIRPVEAAVGRADDIYIAFGWRLFKIYVTGIKGSIGAEGQRGVGRSPSSLKVGQGFGCAPGLAAIKSYPGFDGDVLPKHKAHPGHYHVLGVVGVDD